jgi:AcrR family transcriptional regulator
MNSSRRPYSLGLRAVKAEATRARVRAAAVALHAERLWQGFTLEEVARRAGTTVQTVLRLYGSKEALAVLAMEASAARERRATPPGDVAAAVGALYDDYEAIGDQVIQCLAEEPRHPGFPSMELGRQAHRRWNEAVFGPYLAARDGAARARLLHALIAATDVYVWKLLRRDLGLARAAAEAVVREMIHGLAQGGGDGTVSVGLLGRGREPPAESGDRTRAERPRP